MSRIISQRFAGFIAVAAAATRKVLGPVYGRQEAIDAAFKAMKQSGYENSGLAFKLQSLRDSNAHSMRFAKFLAAGDKERQSMVSSDDAVREDQQSLYGAGGGADGTLQGLYHQTIEKTEDHILEEAKALKEQKKQDKKDMPPAVKEALDIVLGVCIPRNKERVMGWEEAHEKCNEVEEYEEAKAKPAAAQSKRGSADFVGGKKKDSADREKD